MCQLSGLCRGKGKGCFRDVGARRHGNLEGGHCATYASGNQTCERGERFADMGKKLCKGGLTSGRALASGGFEFAYQLE